jgi:hypothetical protein
MTHHEMIFALYRDETTAANVVRELLDAGLTNEDVSVISNDVEGRYESYTNRDMYDDPEDVDASEGAGFGAIVGALTGLGVALIPGVGPILAAGPLGAAILAGIGAVAGAATGSISASLIDLGVPERDALVYQEGVRRGGTLVAVKRRAGWDDRIMTILRHHNPLDVEERERYFRDSGWTGYDPNAEPYDRDSVNRFRNDINNRGY